MPIASKPKKKIAPHFKIVPAKGDQFRAQIIGANGKLVWRTEAYPSKALARNAIAFAMACNSQAETIDATDPAKK